MECARVLDDKRLGKQRVEAYTILRTLLGLNKGGWKNHPAVKMWKGYEFALADYCSAMCSEWMGRGKQDTILEKLRDMMGVEWLTSEWTSKRPPWLGDPNFHASHRSNLLRKKKYWYSRFWPDEPDDLPYIWPVN
jgi:hypothetical protein